MKAVRVLQLGATNFSEVMQISDCADWYYEPDFSELPKEYFDVAILNRNITEDEFDYLTQFLRAYTLFITMITPFCIDDITQQLITRKIGKKISIKELKAFLKEELPDYFSESYGEKFTLDNLSVSQSFSGNISWRGFEGIELDGDFGTELTQSVFWRSYFPIEENQAIEFWLEYAKDDTVEISLELSFMGAPSYMDISQTRTFSEKDLEDIVYIEGIGKRAYVFASLKTKGKGKLTVTALHDRYSRRGKGAFLPGGKRSVTSDREEVFYYFDPGNLKPPLNVYFSGYKTKEGFEGYYMMRRMEHPFLLISEARLEGGAFYLGSAEFEDAIEQIIQYHIVKLGFQSSDVILSGISMGTFGALYYGCRIHPNTILLGKPLASLGDIANNGRINRPDDFRTAFDVLHKSCGSLSQEAVSRLNDKFWNAFDQAKWNNTRFAVAYMIEDDYDMTAYTKLQSHLKDAGVTIYGKGLHGRHNDDTSGIVNWFLKQYYRIIQDYFDNAQSETGEHE